MVTLKSSHTQVDPRLKQHVQDPIQTLEPKLLCSLLREHFLQGYVLQWSGFSGYESNSPNGTLQLSNTNSQVSLPLIPNLSNFGLVEKPWKPCSIINAVMPLEPCSGAVLAYTTRVEATGPLVILLMLIAFIDKELIGVIRTKSYDRSAPNYYPPSQLSNAC